MNLTVLEMNTITIINGIKKKIVNLGNIGKQYFEYIIQGPKQQNCTNRAQF